MMGIGLDSGTIPVLKVLGLNPSGITNRQRITPLPIIYNGTETIDFCLSFTTYYGRFFTNFYDHIYAVSLRLIKITVSATETEDIKFRLCWNKVGTCCF